MHPARFEEDFGRRLRPALLAYFMRRVRNHAEAEDLTQELLMRVMQKDLSDISSPEAYIFQMAANLLADRARRLKVRAHYRDMTLRSEDRAIETIDPHRITVGRMELGQIGKALGTLPERTRTIFILYRIECMGQDAIAEAFGISVSAVKKQVARAMAALMKAIEVAE